MNFIQKYNKYLKEKYKNCINAANGWLNEHNASQLTENEKDYISVYIEHSALNKLIEPVYVIPPIICSILACNLRKDEGIKEPIEPEDLICIAERVFATYPTEIKFNFPTTADEDKQLLADTYNKLMEMCKVDDEKTKPEYPKTDNNEMLGENPC